MGQPLSPVKCHSCGGSHIIAYAGKLRCHCGQTWTWSQADQRYLPDPPTREEVK